MGGSLGLEMWPSWRTSFFHWQNFQSDLLSHQPSLAGLVFQLPLSLWDLIYFTHLHLDVWLLSLFEAFGRDASEAVISAVQGNLSAKLTFTHPWLSFTHLAAWNVSLLKPTATAFFFLENSVFCRWQLDDRKKSFICFTFWRKHLGVRDFYLRRKRKSKKTLTGKPKGIFLWTAAM